MILSQAQWRTLEQRHAERVEPWITPRLQRRLRGRKHPVDDFLFEYYPYSPARLATWHPGHGVTLLGDTSQFRFRGGYVEHEDGIIVDLSALDSRQDRLDLVLRLLAGTQQRPPMVNCFGLHEWAMVYRLEPDQIRHADQPLRLSPEAIAETVDGLGLRCTHIDAFRFFTPQAMPRNSIIPTRATQPDLEQPGCLHANMDLYKYAMWFQPFVGSDLVADCFELARAARDLDMRASPYDCTEFGLAPIPVETPAGRAEYAAAQRNLMLQARPLRAGLVAALARSRAALGGRAATSGRHPGDC